MTDAGNAGSVRVSDAERQNVVNQLNAAFSAGRLTLDEFNDRISDAYAARTRAELDALVTDLPAPDQAPPVSSEAPHATPPPASTTASGRTQWHVSPIGGLKRRGHWRMPKEIVSITLIGGADLDFREAQLDAREVTITKISLIGGVDLKVPSEMRVEVQGFSLLGGSRVDLDESTDPNAPTIVVRAFSILGGVKARNA